MKNCFVFDTCSNIWNKQYKDVFVLSMQISEDQKGKIISYRDVKDITIKETIKKLKDGALLKTSQSAPSDVIEMFDELSKKYDNVYVFPGPMQITKQYTTLKMLANDYKNVHVFLQNTLGVFSKWLIEDLLAMQKKQDLTPEIIQKYLDKTKYTKFGAMCVPDFKYLVRGGRVSKVVGGLASLLKIKVLISYNEAGLHQFGKVINLKKVPNNFNDVFKKLYKGFDIKNVKKVWYGLSGEDDEEFKISTIKKSLEEYFKFDKSVPVYVEPFPSTITCHTGPNYILIGLDLGDDKL